MSLKNGKHIVGEIKGVRCTIVESGISQERMGFIKGILEFNGYQVMVAVEHSKEVEGADTYQVGVTDIVFNPVIAIYERRLKLDDGRVVTPAYWNQQTTLCESKYWIYRKR